MNKTEIKQLALAVYKKEVPANFSASDMEGSLREQFRALAPDFNTYRRNKLEIFELIQEVVDEVAPNRVRDVIGMFAEVKTYGQGQKARFKLKKGRNNVKRFITKVGLGGVLERVRLDSDFIDVSTHAYGGAGYVEFEQFLDGTMDFAELTDLIIQGIEDQIYKEIQTALIGTYASLPAANKHAANSFVSAEMKRIINTVKAYGGNANIFCTPEFAGTLTPDATFIGDADKADMREQGYIGRFNGANVIVLPQSFEDANNTTKVFNAQYAFVIPTGGTADEKIVKVALEGQTVVKDVENADDSMEFKAYKKVGTAVLNLNHFAVYQNTAL
jgi:hypothetical protein